MGSDRPSLKILHVDPEREWGGGECQVMGLLRYLGREGHQSHLLGHPRGRLLQEARKSGIATFPLFVRNDLDFRPIFSLRRLIRKERYDIVHFHTKRAHALTLWLRRIYPEIRYLVTRRMDYPVRKNWYNDYLYNRRIDGVVAISQKIVDLLAQGGVPRERIRLIHSGIDPAPFQKMPATDPDRCPRVIGTAAVLEERKGHRFLLEAAALLKQGGHRLKYRFAGDGSERERLQKIILELGLREDVEMIGFVSDIPAFLSTIDIFVLPSVYEGLGVAILEAMAAGKPVVATRVGGIPELVSDAATGLLVPPMNPQALTQAIERLISQKDLLRQLGEKGRERVVRQFTMEQMARKNEDYYYDLLQMDPERGFNREKEEGSRVGV